MKTKLAVIFLSLILICGLVACKGSSYTVTFDTQGGNLVESQTVKKGEFVARPADPTLDGSRFKGWSKDKDVLDPFSFATPIESNLTVYAYWEKIIYHNVTFDSTGGTSVASQKIEEGKFAEKPQSPTKDGYVFIGWSLSKTQNSGFVFGIIPITDDITLYAHWAPEGSAAAKLAIAVQNTCKESEIKMEFAIEEIPITMSFKNGYLDLICIDLSEIDTSQAGMSVSKLWIKGEYAYIETSSFDLKMKLTDIMQLVIASVADSMQDYPGLSDIMDLFDFSQIIDGMVLDISTVTAETVFDIFPIPQDVSFKDGSEDIVVYDIISEETLDVLTVEIELDEDLIKSIKLYGEQELLANIDITYSTEGFSLPNRNWLNMQN